MCRLLAYLGKPIPLNQILLDPDHSLLVQSYQPQQMTAGLLNADGYGIGWYRGDEAPYTYRSTLPIWNDINLPHLARYIQADCILANVRSATPGLPLDLGNTQPFTHGQLMLIHNGFIADFRHTLYRPLRSSLSDAAYKAILGNTDSEHIFGLILSHLEQTDSLVEATQWAIATLQKLATAMATEFSANLVITDGQELVACRYANRQPMPSLYWLPMEEDADSIAIASEPMTPAAWQAFEKGSLLHIHPTKGMRWSSLAVD